MNGGQLGYSKRLAQLGVAAPFDFSHSDFSLTDDGGSFFVIIILAEGDFFEVTDFTSDTVELLSELLAALAPIRIESLIGDREGVQKRDAKLVTDRITRIEVCHMHRWVLT